MDHGILNIKGRTSGINAELDRWKASIRAEAHAQAKADAAKTREQRATAKALVKEWSDEKCIQIAMTPGVCFPRFSTAPTAKKARAKLMSVAHWTPTRLLHF